jgi:hypothetical protein
MAKGFGIPDTNPWPFWKFGGIPFIPTIPFWPKFIMFMFWRLKPRGVPDDMW